ncbi:MAG: hypothetical protein ACJ762_17300 [Solirubrobacteraceae bacterium]
MSQAQARSWWADVEHLRDAAERRQAADAERRSADKRAADRRARAGDSETTRARTRATSRVLESSNGAVDELSARRAVVLDERAPRPRRPVPIWLADDAFSDPVAEARARAAAPRRTIEIRGQVAMPAPNATPAPRVQGRADQQVARRTRQSPGLIASFAARPDRLAFWAFAMGLMLALVAAMSGGGGA